MTTIESNIQVMYSQPIQRKIFQWNKTDLSMLSDTITQFNTMFLLNNLNISVQSMWDHCLSWLSTKQDVILLLLSTLDYPAHKRGFFIKLVPQALKGIGWIIKKLRIARRECRKVHDEYISHLTDPDNKNTSKRFWTYIKSQRHDHSRVLTLMYGD